MANQDWYNLGEDIKNMVQSAIDSKDFKQLNESINETIGVALNSVNESLRQAGDKINEAVEKVPPQNPWAGKKQKSQEQFGDRPDPGSYRVSTQSPRIYRSTTGMSGAGYALSICGYTLAGGLGIACFVLLLLAFLDVGFITGFRIALGVMFPLLIGSIIMARSGTRILSRLKRFRSYTRYLGGRTYCSIKELADHTGKSSKFVLKDVKDMIQRRMFLQGYVDQQGTCLMVNEETYQQYQLSQKQIEEREKEELLLQTESQKQEEGLPEEVRKVIETGKTYLDQIRRSNAAIPEEKITKKISRMELIIHKIFQRVEQQPQLVSELRKFMDYYLPTTVKLLDAYEELDAQAIQGQNILNSKKEIEDTLDTINEAFENLLDSFFQDKAWDISSDISVLQTMLAQEGLTNSDFGN